MRVAVIMSTYNGEKYLRQQIDSILQQLGVDVELYIRDDGSTDTTIEIVEEYMQHYPNVHLEKGKNLGFGQSFIQELLKIKEYKYYAFSDQDDFWENDKLLQGSSQVGEALPQIPAVYYSNLNVSDENLNIYRKTKLQYRKQSLESLVMRRSIAGCTMVFNKAMWQQIEKRKITDNMLMHGHDSFIISLCYALRGKVICDPNAYIRYRQHTLNTSGSSHGIRQRLNKEWNNLTKKKGSEPAIARSILCNWGDEIRPKEKRELQLIEKSECSILARFKILFSKNFITGNILLTILGKIKVFLGLL